jgi:putative transposase
VKRHRHTPEQAVRKVREGERLLNDGKDLAEILRALEISEATWNRWRSQYGGMKASAAKRLRELEAENTRLKRLVATRRWTSTCSRSWPRETSDPGASPQGRWAPAGPLRGL